MRPCGSEAFVCVGDCMLTPAAKPRLASSTFLYQMEAINDCVIHSGTYTHT